MSETIDATNRYSKIDKNKFILAKNTIEYLEPGVYRAEWDSNAGIYIIVKEEVVSDSIVITSETSKKIIKQIDDFWTMEEQFKENGLIHKRGFLLVGKPGCGKSSIINDIAEKSIAAGSIVFYPSASHGGSDLSHALKTIKAVESNKKVLVVLEDFESFLERRVDKTLWLNIMDGVNGFNNIVFLATSNYPEQIDERFTKRPSRFDTLYVVDAPTYNDRLKYIKNRKIELSEGEAEKIAKETDGMSYAQIKELLVSVYLFKLDYRKTYDKLVSLETDVITSDDFDGGKKTKIGFHGAEVEAPKPLPDDELEDIKRSFLTGNTNTGIDQ